MKYIVIFIEWGYEFKSQPCSYSDACILIDRLEDKGITNAYKTESGKQ